MAVKLFFERFQDKEINSKLPGHYVIRLKCALRFLTKNGLSAPYPAIIDTGAHTSVIPKFIWMESVHQIYGEHKIYGISKNKECVIPCNIGIVGCIIVDDEDNETRELRISAFLANTDEIPLIIGFKDVLEKFKMVIEFSKNNAFIE